MVPAGVEVIHRGFVSGQNPITVDCVGRLAARLDFSQTGNIGNRA